MVGNEYLSSCLFLLLLFCLLCQAEKSPTCSPKCSKLTNVTFPFGTQIGCGLPEFLLSNCSSTEGATWTAPVSQLDSVPFHVGAITDNNVTNGTVLLQTVAAACPPVPYQFTSWAYDRSGLSLSPLGNIKLVFGCDPNSTKGLGLEQFHNGFIFSSLNCRQFYRTCAMGSNQSVPCFEAVGSGANMAELNRTYKCGSSVSMYSIPLRMDDVWELQVAWAISQYYYDCIHCKASGGSCERDSIDGSFLCSCQDGLLMVNSSSTCAEPTSSKCKMFCSSSVKISLGVGAVAMTFFIVSIGCCIYPRGSLPSTDKRRRSCRAQLRQLSNACGLKKLLDGYCKGSGDQLLRSFTYHELAQATNSFSTRAMIGDGGFGIVFEGTLKSTGEKVAIKKLHAQNERSLEHFANEIRILSTLDHLNLVKLYGFCAHVNDGGGSGDGDSCYSIDKSLDNDQTVHESDPMDCHLLLIYEFVSNGTLAHNLHGIASKGLLWETRLCIAIETANAIAYLHSRKPPIVHRDVKSGNILLDENFHAKLGDFGLSRELCSGMSDFNNDDLQATHVSTTPQGTPGYLDPEYHACYHLTDKSDVYSFGVVLIELISGKVPVDMSREQGQVNLSGLAVSKIQSGALKDLVDPYLEVWHYPSIKEMVWKVAELAFLCLAPIRDDRPSMEYVASTLLQIRNTSYPQ